MTVREIVSTVTTCFRNVLLPETTLQLNFIIAREPGYRRSGVGEGDDYRANVSKVAHDGSLHHG
jgi:hypothetical protein